MNISAAELAFLRSLPRTLVERARATRAADGREQEMAKRLARGGMIKMTIDADASTRDVLVVLAATTEAGEEAMRAARAVGMPRWR